MEDRFTITIETDARPSDWRMKIDFADFTVKLSPDNADDLAAHIATAIERKANSKEAIAGDPDWKLTVIIYGDVITLERWDAIEATATTPLSKSEAKHLARELILFSEEARRH